MGAARSTAEKILASVIDDIDIGNLMDREEFANLSFDELLTAHQTLLEGKITITWD